MSVDVNRVIIAGKLTRDPQIRFLQNEKAVANFGIAINSRFKASDGTMKEDVTFVEIEAWSRTAELVGQYLTRGKACLIEGRLKMDKYEKEGVKHTKLKVVAESVQFLGGKSDGERQEAASETAAAPQKQTKATAPSSVADDYSSPPF